MVGLQNEVDANFFNLIHKLAGSEQQEPAADGGEDRRHPPLSTQRVAPLRGPDMPPESEFDEVQCRDLTRSGFSFLLPTRPDFDSLVAAFGTPPNVIYVSARVTNCEPALVRASGELKRVETETGSAEVVDSDDRAPIPMVLVHCRFIARLSV